MSAAPVGGDYDLVDHDGASARPRRFSDRYSLIFFGFTHCRVVCPETLSRLSEAIERADLDPDALQPLYITVDPERDTPDRMRAFLRERFPRFLGLTGSRDAVDRARQMFKVFAQRANDPDDPDGYAVPHSAYAFLMAPGGACAAYFPSVATVEEISDRLREHVASDRAGPGAGTGGG